jgi:ATP phosphoribosyltransferase regulatory subunit
MNSYRLITPKGTKDILLDECQTRRWIEQKLRKVFIGYGYQEVITPGIEFLDVFQRNEVNTGCEDMFKLIDHEGRILVLRPDSTAPIARLVSTRLKESCRPIRLFYNQRVYLQKGMYSGRRSETAQMGIELIGSNTTIADLEVISLAAEALKRSWGQDFRLEIGHSGFFEILVNRLNLEEGQKEQLRQLIDAKNFAALNDILDKYSNHEAAEALKQLPHLFGRAEVFALARDIFKDEETKALLDYLHWLYEALLQLGLKDSVMLDLGFVNRNNYYTGVIFQGYVQGSGEVVLSGGRYDQLLGQFGPASPAIGFGIDIDILTKKRLEQGLEKKAALPKVLVFGEPGYEVLSLQYAHTLRQQPDMIVENGLFKDRQDCLAYAMKKAIAKVHIVGKTIEVITITDNCD